MSIQADISAAARWHLGEDKKLLVTVYSDADQQTCVDVSAFTLSWKLSETMGGTALITKTSSSGIVVSGAFNADPLLNTQVVEISVDDVDTQPDTGPALAARTYHHELKRTDAGVEAILCQGRVTLLAAVHAI